MGAIVALIILGIPSAIVAHRKGFGSLRWLLAFGPIGLIVVVLSRSANTQGISSAEAERRARRVNIAGAVLFGAGLVFVNVAAATSLGDDILGKIIGGDFLPFLEVLILFMSATLLFGTIYAWFGWYLSPQTAHAVKQAPGKSLPQDRDSGVPQANHPKTEQNNDSLLQLCCSNCGTRYVVGRDSVLITMEMVKNLLDMAATITSSNPESAVKKDLVSHVSAVPVDRRPAVLAQSASALQSVITSLKAKQKRVWICHGCKVQNEYQGQELGATATTETSGQSGSRTTTSASSISDLSGTSQEQTSEQGKPRRNSPSAHSGQDVLVGIAHLYASQFPGLYKLFGGLSEAVKYMATDGPKEIKCMAPQGSALAVAVANATQLAEAHKRSEFLAQVRETFAKADREALVYMCMSWANQARTVLLVKAQLSPEAMNDKETKAAFLTFHSDTLEVTLSFAEELGLDEQDIRRIDKAHLGMFFASPDFLF